MLEPQPLVLSEAAQKEKRKLRKELSLFFMVCFTLTAMINIDTLGAVSSQGGQVFPWLLITALTFLIPYGLLTAELGSTFPEEGGIYVWCKLAGGRFFAAIASIFYWVSNPLWVGGTLAVTTIAALKTFWFGNSDLLFGGNRVSDAIVEIVIALVFIWFTTWSAIVSLRIGKWFSTIGIILKLSLLGLFVILALAFFFGGKASGAHLSWGDLLPTTNLGLIFSSIIPVLVFNWAGFELQNGAGEEMFEPQRDVPRSLLRAGLIGVLAYAIPILVILLALPKDQLSNVGGFLDAYQAVASILPAPVATALGWLIALALILTLASAGGTWLMGADRTYAVTALDGAAPLILGRFSARFGTPLATNLLSGMVATLAMVAAILVTAFGSGELSTLFSLVLGFTISTTALSYAFIFISYIILRYKYPDVERPYRVPGGMVGPWLVTLLALASVLVTAYFTLVPTDETVSGYQISRVTYELTQLLPIAIVLVVAVLFYLWGRFEQQHLSAGQVPGELVTDEAAPSTNQ
ncbi:APC family permease [Thermogemmatispora onikobensis]|uniref:APC family permease n=1 Tax=Thermogemmatispora onikobensis TaxID=732234 RepID=UPI000853C022|nr:APC family permease [Thermogemmatispora onikobensis]